MIDYIFRAILPDYGMTERPAQIKLSHEMLEAMLGGKIALCDAGTGIGKTYAYLVAGAAVDRCRGTKPFQPILISTSSIALQGAVQEEYLPKLSHALLMAGLIDTPLQAVVRKGKSHYVCDKLLEKRLRQVSGAKKTAKALAVETLEQTAKPLLEKLAQPREETEALEEYLRLLAPLTRSMPIVQRQVGRLLPSPGRKRMDTLASAVALFSRNDSEMLFYLAEDERGGTMLCATPADLTAKLRQTLWRTECSFVLTSGTLAVGNDFQRYRIQVGLREERRVQESVAHSPFDYHEHCLRYLPLFPPKQRAGQAEEYFDELTAEIMDLLKASYGHALVLFTSYAAMSAVKDRLQKEILRVPLFTLGRNAVHILEEFRATPGSVLLATGAAW